jgi:hypothetical protein
MRVKEKIYQISEKIDRKANQRLILIFSTNLLKTICAHIKCNDIILLALSLHCKKRLALFLSPAGMSLTKLSLAGNNLKVPKCEIFDRSDFHYFYTMKPFWGDDFVVKILTYYLNFWGSQDSFSF